MIHNGHNVTVCLFYPCITRWLLSVYSFSLALHSTTLWHHYEFMPCQTLHIESGRSTPSWKPARCNLHQFTNATSNRTTKTNKQTTWCKKKTWAKVAAMLLLVAKPQCWTAESNNPCILNCPPAVSGQGIAGLCLPTILTKVLARSGRGGSRTCMEHNRWTESVLLATQLRSQAELRKDHLTNWNEYIREPTNYEHNEESFGKIVRVLCGHHASGKTALIQIYVDMCHIKSLYAYAPHKSNKWVCQTNSYHSCAIAVP